MQAALFKQCYLPFPWKHSNFHNQFKRQNPFSHYIQEYIAQDDNDGFRLPESHGVLVYLDQTARGHSTVPTKPIALALTNVL